MDTNLSQKEKTFCERYAISQDKYKAYLESGYASTDYKSAIRKANRILGKSEASAYIASFLNNLNVGSELILNRLERIAFSSVEYFLDDTGRLSTETAKENGVLDLAKSITQRRYKDGSVSTKLELLDSQKALDTLARYVVDSTSDLSGDDIIIARVHPSAVAAEE